MSEIFSFPVLEQGSSWPGCKSVDSYYVQSEEEVRQKGTEYVFKGISLKYIWLSCVIRAI